MANPTNGILKTTTATNATWEYPVANVGTLKLQTAGKYVDRDIDIKVKAGTFSSSVSTISENSRNNPAVKNTISVDLPTGIQSTITDIEPTGQNEKYITLTPSGVALTEASTQLEINAIAKIDESGWVNKNSSQTSDSKFYDVSFATSFESAPLYLPIRELTEDKVSGVALVEIEEGKPKDNFQVTINIPEGYYRGNSSLVKTFENILPDFAPTTDDTGLSFSESLLAGSQLYTDKGDPVYGTMVNYGDNAGNAFTINLTKGEGNVVGGTGVTLVNTSDYSKGLQVLGSGEVSGTASVSTGYYVGQTTSADPISSEQATKVIKSLTLSGTNELESITNGGKISTITNSKTISTITNTGTISTITNTGTISTLAGTGTINSLTGSQTINSLTGSQKIKTLSGTIEVENAATASNKGTIKFGTTTFVNNGVIQAGSVEEITETVDNKTYSTGKLQFNPGWLFNNTMDLMEGEIGVSETEKSLVNPTIEYSFSKSGIASEATFIYDQNNPNDPNKNENKSYYITYNSTMTEGSYSSKANVEITTPGYISTDKGNEMPISGKLTITDVTEDKEKRIYLREATFSNGLSSTKMAASGSRPANAVPAEYEFKVVTPGYTPAKSGFAKLAVFGGEYTWTTT